MSTASSSGPRRPPNSNAIAGPSSSSSPRWFSQTQAASPPSAPSVPTLPSAETQRHVSEARAAVVASIGNMLDSELQSRAGILHSNAAALEKQERDVLRATDGLRKETQKLKAEADKAARKVKELGNVQNWAEVLERGFLVLEETVRLANGGEDSDEAGSQCTCSCSECGSDSDMDVEEGEGSDGGHGNANSGVENGAERRMDVDGMSDASRSLMDLDSSTGTGRAKGSETASISTG
ncbi:GCN5-like protein 1 (GCN5L1) domain-containing protein [Trichoderma breve]|uniref:Biogenesis of lysosome-related organelles complex 1 subunit 1 n=1 Tax=Trichoderma breve TaxID=2034170 RepID=A0A9W9BC22_9HYPO|nr:GCN5-like protein 1 (GCN5L1) domain-containing protein [Trichoderma breve]KAJ4860487.1 GCN5-like protein 1 (GCN5L1) domain-containing protein [Trichoderma breve]